MSCHSQIYGWVTIRRAPSGGSLGEIPWTSLLLAASQARAGLESKDLFEFSTTWCGSRDQHM